MISDLQSPGKEENAPQAYSLTQSELGESWL